MTTHAAATRRRGQPLVALVLLLAGWTAARFALWETPFARAVKASVERAGTTPPLLAGQTPITPPSRDKPHPVWVRGWMPQFAGISVEPTVLQAAAIRGLEVHPPLPTLVPIPPPPPRAVLLATPAVLQPVAVPKPLPGRRLHLAAWAAWREGSQLPQVATGGLPPSYGGSQAGLLAQFDLTDGPRRPALHVRTTYAPDRPQQAEIAAGVGLRPVPALPVRILGEMRATHVEDRTEVRQALFAVTEFAPLSLPLGVRAEGYAQGGWVGGRYATAFADGQMRVTHAAVAAGPARLRVGAGAWGGAQKFARRLDVGPTITADLAPLRLALDYRVRVAGNARPGNGLALTLSTGF